MSLHRYLKSHEKKTKNKETTKRNSAVSTLLKNPEGVVLFPPEFWNRGKWIFEPDCGVSFASSAVPGRARRQGRAERRGGARRGEERRGEAAPTDSHLFRFNHHTSCSGNAHQLAESRFCARPQLSRRLLVSCPSQLPSHPPSPSASLTPRLKQIYHPPL